ncbi:MAG: PorV/PorQ family protein [Bacteroidia bacterium]
MKYRIALFFLFAVSMMRIHAQILPSFGDSRTGGTGMQFLKIATDARSTALGGAYVAIANDVASLYWNPAGITQTDTGKVNCQLSYAKYFGDISANFAGAVMKAGKYSYIGLSVFTMNYGQMLETTEFDPKGTGRTFSPVNYSIGISYAKILTNSFSFGLTGKFAQEGYAGVNVNNVMFDLGLKYNVGVKNTRFGVSFSNFGLNVNPSGSVSVLKFNGPQTISTFSEVSVPAIFRLGVAFDPIHTNEHILTLAGQLNHPTDNNETYSIGAEYIYHKFGFLRSGYEFFADETNVVPNFGAGIKLLRNFGGITIDYGVLVKSRLGNVQRITLAINIR